MANNIFFKSEERLKGYTYAFKRLNILYVAPEIFECIMDRDTYLSVVSQLKYVEMGIKTLDTYISDTTIPLLLLSECTEAYFLEAKELLKKYNNNL